MSNAITGQRWNASFAAGLTSAALLVVCVSGCNKSSVDRHNLSGQVTYQGKPVPAGSIVFEPDVANGGSGPQGFAVIQEGRYSTRDTGKGTPLGAVRVRVSGFAYMAKGDEAPPPRLFETHEVSMEITRDTTVFDIEVPSS